VTRQLSSHRIIFRHKMQRGRPSFPRTSDAAAATRRGEARSGTEKLL
jgi:hypothetical protein